MELQRSFRKPEGQRVFAPGYLDLIADWVKQRFGPYALIHSGLFRDGSFRHMFSSWRIDQWVEVDRPAHAEGLRN